MKNYWCTICFCSLSFLLSGQSFNPDQIRSGSLEDINYLAKGYLSPAARALGISLNNGWYSTGKTHNLGRFDLMLTPSLILIPEYDHNFTIRNDDMQALELVDQSITQASTPTVFGANVEGPALKLKDDPFNVSEFRAPAGVGFAVMPSTMAQLSVGLIKNTNISIRYIPEIGVIGLEEGKIGVIGAAIKHDIFQWIPGLKALPLNVSGFAGYTKLNYTQALDDGSGNDDQELEIISEGYTARLIVSKKFLFLTPYAAVGYNMSRSKVNIKGTYEYYIVSGPINAGKQTETDPVSFETVNDPGFVGNIGVQIKFLFVGALTADYTFGAYDSFTLGAGISLDF